ncbi:MAG: hypothetical protein MJ137_00295 [Clostridia bacterium]|nr:hypothetical protein [Clostridia bacterium]
MFTAVLSLGEAGEKTLEILPHTADYFRVSFAGRESQLVKASDVTKLLEAFGAYFG